MNAGNTELCVENWAERGEGAPGKNTTVSTAFVLAGVDVEKFKVPWVFPVSLRFVSGRARRSSEALGFFKD